MNKYLPLLKYHMLMKVPTFYRYNFSNHGYFPTIPLVLLKGRQRVRSLALIDSRASISIFRTEVAEKLGIDIESGEQRIMTGVGGKIAGYLHKVKIRVAEKNILCPVIFSKKYKASFNLLDRQGFFDKFIITFDEKRKHVILS